MTPNQPKKEDNLYRGKYRKVYPPPNTKTHKGGVESVCCGVDGCGAIKSAKQEAYQEVKTIVEKSCEQICGENQKFMSDACPHLKSLQDLEALKNKAEND